MSDKKFCGNGKKWGNFGGIKLGLKQSDLVFNDKGWCNIIVSPKKDKPEEYYAYIDDFVPSQRSQSTEQATQTIGKDESLDDLPF